jgi:tetratricopeptide (TPR) repeat protein
LIGAWFRRSPSAALLLALAACAPWAWSQADGPKSSSAAHAAQSIKQQFEAARDAYQAGRYSDAWTALQSLVATNPGNAYINELAGMVQAAMGNKEKAQPYLTKAARLNPNIADWQTALAVNLVELHRAAEAEAHFVKAAELQPGSYDANHNAGEFYAQSGNLKAAIPYLRRAQELDPTHYNNGYDLALACEQVGQLDEARQLLQALVARHDTAELHSFLGEVEEKSKNYFAAAQEYERAARMDPTEDHIFAWGAELLVHQTYEPALAVFEAGLKQFPQSSRLQLAVGVAQYGMGRFDDGARQFCGVWDDNPSDPMPLEFAGKVYTNLSPPIADQVRSRLARLVASGGGTPSIRYYYAVSLWKEHENNPDAVPANQIVALLKNVISQQPDNADAHSQLGAVYAEQHDYADAAKQFEQAIKYAPNIAANHYRLGQALAREGEKTRAQAEFAIFERLHKQQVADTEKQNGEIQQFVYSMRNGASGAAKSQ